MANVSTIFGGAFVPPELEQQIIDPPEVQLRDAIAKAGLEPPSDIYIDGKIHRFNAGSKGGKSGMDKSGWYVAYGDGIPAGRFGDWRTDIEMPWRADVGRKLSAAEEMAHVRRLSELRVARNHELAKQHEIASNTVDTIWTDCMAAHPDHPYLKKKNIMPHGARITGDGRLVFPLYDEHGVLSSLQYVDVEGNKLYHSGGATGGKFAIIGSIEEPGVIYIAEGFATAATVHEETGRPCVVSYSASNIVPVTGIMRDRFGVSQEIVIVADHDKSGVGQRYAEQACAKFGARFVVPEIEGDANDYKNAGLDLLLLINPVIGKDDWLEAADSFCSQAAPIGWLVKHWLQEKALIMVHGPSGGGKTFVVLDWCLKMAAGHTEWFGHKTKPGSTIYLAGEGHQGLRGRVAAWKQHHNAGHLDMWVSKSGCDLNTPEGFERVVRHVNSLDVKPNIIVVDTLHRFLSGDENSSQDAKTMLDACNKLMIEFNCSVLLVHHTGVSEETQTRARGSSAWRGALDIEISVIPNKQGKPMQLVQRKSKDAELANDLFAELKTVEINGWFDEDGEAVTSAVIVQADAPAKETKKESDISKEIRKLSNAWFNSGAELNNNSPYLSRSSLLNYLVTNEGISEASARTYIKPSQKGRMIYELLNAQIITAHEHGWAVTDDATASSMMLRIER